MKSRGFTLIELVVTLIIIGVLSALVMPRFFNRTAFDARAFADQMAAVIRHAQKTAVAQRRLVCVALNAPATLTVTIAANNAASVCTGMLPLPGQQNNILTAANGITFTTTQAAINFDGLGRASNSARISVPMAGSPPITINVEPETGYVY